MSLWSRIADALRALANGEGLSAVFEKLQGPPERTVAFTIAVIALGAKMAKADGRVTRNEVTAFREVFHIPPEEEAAAARVFDLARQDVAGFDLYAARIARMFAEDGDTLADVLEGLFHIAVADGEYHEEEDAFLSTVARIFGISAERFRRMRARFVPEAAQDPYTVLGVSPDMPLADIRRAWRDLVKESHPDRMVARGVPEEAIRMAETRMARINHAWDEISKAQHA